MRGSSIATMQGVGPLKIYTPREINEMSDDECKASPAGGFGQMLGEMAHRHVT